MTASVGTTEGVAASAGTEVLAEEDEEQLWAASSEAEESWAAALMAALMAAGLGAAWVASMAEEAKVVVGWGKAQCADRSPRSPCRASN